MMGELYNVLFKIAFCHHLTAPGFLVWAVNIGAESFCASFRDLKWSITPAFVLVLKYNKNARSPSRWGETGKVSETHKHSFHSHDHFELASELVFYQKKVRVVFFFWSSLDCDTQTRSHSLGEIVKACFHRSPSDSSSWAWSHFSQNDKNGGRGDKTHRTRKHLWIRYCHQGRVCVWVVVVFFILPAWLFFISINRVS